MKIKGNSNQTNRVDIVKTVQTPLGFFTLAVLVVELILGVAVNSTQGSGRGYLIISMIVLIFFLVAIVCRIRIFQTRSPEWETPRFKPEHVGLDKRVCFAKAWKRV